MRATGVLILEHVVNKKAIQIHVACHRWLLSHSLDICNINSEQQNHKIHKTVACSITRIVNSTNN